MYALASPDEAASAETIATAPLTGRSALIKLTESSFLLGLSGRAELTQMFYSFGRLAASIAMRRLTIPRDYTWLQAACEAVLADE